MDIETSPVSILNTVGSIPDVIINQGFQNKVLQPITEEIVYIVSLEQDNGTTELVQVTKEQADALGICLYDSSVNSNFEIGENIKSYTLGPVKNVKDIYIESSNASGKIERTTMKTIGLHKSPVKIMDNVKRKHSTPNISADYLQQIAKALNLDNTNSKNPEGVFFSDVEGGKNIIYRVVFPEELNLKPSQTKRGRPKKSAKISEKNVEEQPKPVQNVRTRSGRITRPPRYIKKDFSKIDTSKTDNNESDLRVFEFEPLKTNRSNVAELPSVEIEEPVYQKRKRNIASQYRCPTCHKAYLGQNRMLKHIQIHPDHGPLPEHSKIEENDTWNYLVNISNSTTVGQRGFKFCKQLLTLIHNVQLMAKLLFKRPSNSERNSYFIDSFLSQILGIDSGNYVVNESQLQRDVNLLKFITEGMPARKNDNKKQIHTFDLHDYIEKSPLEGLEGEESKRLKHEENIPILEDSNSDNFNCIVNDSKTNVYHRDINFGAIQNDDSNIEVANIKLDSLNFHQELEFEQHIPSNFSDEHRTIMDPAMNVIISCDDQQSNMGNTSNEFSLQNDLLSDSSILNSLPVLRTSVDELILSTVESAQVTNLLDNSISSDDVMNVDQFVNESFKNFAESDMELPNAPLSLDLPSLELFEFPSS